MTEFIYLQTVQHTGTWFIVGFVMDHEEMGGMIQEDHISAGLRKGDMIQENHVRGGKVLLEGIVPDKKNLIFTHIASHSLKKPPFLCPRQMMITLACNRPLVVPLRDPLLAMITHRGRHPDWEEKALFHKITTWQLYFKFLADFEKHRRVIYCPLDALTGDNKLVVLKKIQEAYGLKDDALAEKWAAEWPVINSYVKHEDPPKQAYYNRDLAWFSENMPRELAALREWEHVFRPILEKWYTDLLWWS